ncbi:MAG: hypothetical protein RR998_03605 [Oscillospiraceae bacterium]
MFNNRKANLVLTIVFLMILLLPSALFAFAKNYVDTENHENRKLASFPDKDTAIIDLPEAFDAWYIDHLPFKNQFTAANSLLQISLFNTTTSPRVIVGREGWLFFNNYDADDNPITDILGENEFTKGERNTILSNIENCAARYPDKEFLLLIAPNKENIYREMLPDYLLERAVTDSRVDLLYDELSKKTDRVVYPRTELLAAAADNQVYYKYDTHWNLLGGYVGVRAVCGRLGVTLPELSKLKICDSGIDYPRDLAALAGIQSRSNDDRELYPSAFGTDIAVDSSTYTFSEGSVIYTSTAADNRKVMFIHDSFYKSMVSYLPLVFSDVLSVDRNYYDLHSCHAAIEHFQPDIIIMEVAERGAVLLKHENMPY